MCTTLDRQLLWTYRNFSLAPFFRIFLAAQTRLSKTLYQSVRPSSVGWLRLLFCVLYCLKACRTQKLSDPTITMPKFNEEGVFKPLPFLCVTSNPFKNGTKRFSFENRFHWWGHKLKLNEKQAIYIWYDIYMIYNDIAGFSLCHWTLL